MPEPLRPARGGFLRPFGCGRFIREYLLGHGSAESPKLDHTTRAPQSDIFYYYKMAIISATASDRATCREERQARQEKRSISPDNIEKLTDKYAAQSPYKAHGCRYHSFVVYFSTLRRLGWAEKSGIEEPSAFQNHYAEGPPRRYYRLTQAGRAASEGCLGQPLSCSLRLIAGSVVLWLIAGSFL